jgi:hypothetical protein
MAKMHTFVSAIFVTLLLAFALEGRGTIVLPESRSESVLENSRDCSPNDISIHLLPVAQREVARQIRNIHRYHAGIYQNTQPLFLSHISKTPVSKVAPEIACTIHFSSVLRI